MQLREYGTSGPQVLVLHGGPGAPGYVAPVARRLGEWYRVLEPFQRGSGGARLTVARHVSDLHEIVETCCRDSRPAIVGRAYEETWDDMIRRQEEGVYPAAFTAIEAPAIMLHGAADPHPGRMIQASLAPCLPQLEYYEWARCGHYPWLEADVADEFFTVLRDWIDRTTRQEHPCT